MGRNAIQITPRIKNQIKKLAAQGASQSAIASKLGISTKTFERWLSNPELRELYDAARSGATNDRQNDGDLEEVKQPSKPHVEAVSEINVTPAKSASIEPQSPPTTTDDSATEPPKRRGPKPREVTPEDAQQIELLAGFGLTLDRIAAALGVSPSTLDTWLKIPEISVLYKMGKAKAEAVIGQTLFQKAKDGNIPALIWFEKTRYGRSEKKMDELEALKVLAEAGWFPESLMVGAAEEFDDLRLGLKAMFQRYFSLEGDRSAPAEA